MSRAMNQGLAPLKSSEYDRLLRRWGFEPIDHGGNHPMYLAPNGISKFPISAAGKVTQRELRQAAKLVGVSRRAFLLGPPKNRPIRRVEVEDDLISRAQAHLDEQVALAEQRAKENRVAKVIEEKRPYTKGVGEKVEQYVRDHPLTELRIRDVEEAVGSTGKGTVALALRRMAEQDGLLRSTARGTYMYGEDRRKAQVPTRSRRRSTDPKKNGNLRNDILSLLEENEGRPMSVDLVVQKLGTIRSSTANALLQLSRIGAIEQMGRGIYRFQMPHMDGVLSRDETPEVSTHPDDEPIELYPTEQEYISQVQGVPNPIIHSATMWEEMKDLGDGRFLLRDENGELWVAKMQRLELI